MVLQMLRSSFKPWSSLAKAYPGLPLLAVAPQSVFLWVSKLTDGPFKCSGAASSLGANLPRLTLAYRGTAKCILMGFEIDGWTLRMLRSFKPWGSLAKAYRGAAKCILMGFEIDGWTLQMLRSFRPTLAYLCLPWHRKVFSNVFRN